MHVLGIDAGGTKTVCLLADGDGRILARARGGGANLKTAGELEVEKVLHAVMDEVIGGQRDLRPDAICLGMAGADRERDRQTVQGILRRIGHKARTLVVNDALIALVAGAGDRPGLVVLAGTGSIAYGRNEENRAARAGGWGYVIGDEGSGFWIGRCALGAVMREFDGRGPRTALTPLILEHFAVMSAGALIPVIYDHEMPPGAIAAVCPLVQRAWTAADPVAVAILEDAAAELASAGQSVASRLGLGRDPFPCLLAGGAFQGAPSLRDLLASRLATLGPDVTVSTLDAEPALGAVMLALAEARGGALIPSY